MSVDNRIRAGLAPLLLLWALLGPVAASAADTRDPYQFFFNPTTGDLRAELADAKRDGKKAVFVMFEQEGCPGCMHMKTRVLNRPDVQAFYRSHFLNFTIDINGSVPVTDFAGREFTEKSYAQSASIKGTPTLVFHDLSGQEIVRIVGTIREPDEFLLLGEFVASGAYKNRKFAEFKRGNRPWKGS